MSSIQFKRWKDTPYSSYSILGANDNTPMFHEADQGSLGNCYFVASMAAAAEFPELISNMFVNK